MLIASEHSVANVAITGASGYVGNVLVRAFRQAGWHVTAMTRQNPQDPSLSWLQYSLAGPPSSETLRAAKIDVLVHAAYDFSAQGSRIEDLNVAGSQQLFERAKAAGVPRLIFISSASATENAASRYGRAKWTVEQRVIEMGGIAVRPGLVFGNEAGGMMGKMRTMVKTRSFIPALQVGGPKLYLVSENDLGGLLLSLAAAPSVEKPLVVAAGLRAWTTGGILRQLAADMHRTVTIVPVPWPVAWLGLRLLELLGKRLAFRSDSILSLIHENPELRDTRYRLDHLVFQEFGAQ